MILVSSPKKPFTYTAKNTARRQAIIADYEEEIDSLYSAVQKTTQPHISVPAEWTSDAVLEFIRVIVSEVLKRGVGDDEDIFESGCDRYVLHGQPDLKRPYAIITLVQSVCRRRGLGTQS